MDVHVEVLFAAVPVTRLSTAQPWYESLFGRPPDVVPNEHEVMWQVVGSGWLYVLEDADRAGHAVVTLCFADLDDAVTQIRDRGLLPGPSEPVGDAGRKAILTDPDGNSVALIEVSAS